MAFPGKTVPAARVHAPIEKLDTLQSNMRSLQRGLKVLRLISRNSGIEAGEIAEQIGLARPTVYRLLETLEEEGYVIRSASDNRFRITRETQSLGIGYDAVHSIRQVAGPVLVELSHRALPEGFVYDLAQFRQSDATCDRRKPCPLRGQIRRLG